MWAFAAAAAPRLQFTVRVPLVTGMLDGTLTTATIAGYGGDVVMVDVTVEVLVEKLV